MGFTKACDEVLLLFGEEFGRPMVNWLTIIRNSSVEVIISPQHENHWLVQIFRSVPQDTDTFNTWYDNHPLDEEDYHPMKTADRLEEIDLVSWQAFMLYGTLARETWMPACILAYLYALSNQNGNDYHRELSTYLTTADDFVHLFGSYGLFQLVCNKL